ncbi:MULTISPECIES: NAD(P)H-dependent flavin oxidoreductase [Bacillus amyloliquefaciens group]|uniref:NAD(P)H-dependent flavin oxidoreductase n=1 Tax=Bacillus amyloliquefaciens group TaxID=1938374 RepID=UPI0008F80EC3|nr:nitronate monooxygenase [Bacillus velezensis]QQY04613.1 nitronate monooxygenase [Bacillus velezensis]UYP22071.1 nitronate monooxygenase [Bacillus velezensis]
MSEWMSPLSLTKPVIQAPMAGGLVTPRLASAVSNEGALGSLASGYVSPQALEKQLIEMKELTDRSFQVNLFVPEERQMPEAELVEKWKARIPRAKDAKPFSDLKEEWNDFEEKAELLIRYGVKACSFTFGLPPEETAEKLKKSGCFLFGTATTPEEAKAFEERGMDAVILQGIEAGGHRGSFLPVKGEPALGLMALIPQAKDALDIPVIAAGGIFDRRGVQAARCLGADGAQVGTPFLLCEESSASPAYQKAIAESKGADTRLTTLFSGKQARGIVNQFMKTYEADEGKTLPYPLHNTLTKPMRGHAAQSGDAEYMSLWAGQSAAKLEGPTDVKTVLDGLCES